MMGKVWVWAGQRRKAIVAEVALVVTWAQVAYVPDGTISRAEWIALVTALLGGVGVHAVTNIPLQSAVDVVRQAFRLTKTDVDSTATALGQNLSLGVGGPPAQARVPVPEVITPQYPPVAATDVPTELPPGEAVVGS